MTVMSTASGPLNLLASSNPINQQVLAQQQIQQQQQLLSLMKMGQLAQNQTQSVDINPFLSMINAISAQNNQQASPQMNTPSWFMAMAMHQQQQQQQQQRQQQMNMVKSSFGSSDHQSPPMKVNLFCDTLKSRKNYEEKT